MSEPVFPCKGKQTNKLLGPLVSPGTGAAPLPGAFLHRTSFETCWARDGTAGQPGWETGMRLASLPVRHRLSSHVTARKGRGMWTNVSSR